MLHALPVVLGVSEEYENRFKRGEEAFEIDGVVVLMM